MTARKVAIGWIAGEIVLLPLAIALAAWSSKIIVSLGPVLIAVLLRAAAQFRFQ